MSSDLTGESDEQLMARISNGDQEAFRTFINRHLSRILAVAQRMSGNWSDAEEIAQDALFRVWRYALSHREGKTHADTWLSRIVINLAIDRLRAREQTPLSIQEGANPKDPQPDAEMIAESREIEALMKAAIQQLPPRQRMAVTLCFFNGLDCAEAAHAMHISVSAMEALLVRGRRTLRRRYAMFCAGNAI